MDYPKLTTLKFAANINLTKLEPKQKDAIDKHNYGTLSHLRFNRLNPQLDLCHKILKGSKVETTTNELSFFCKRKSCNFYKEGCLMVWANYMSPCNSIIGLYFKGTCDVISVTMAMHEVHKSVL